MTPVGICRRTRSRASAKSRVAGTTMATPSGTGASSSTRTKRSSMIRPALTSRIDALLEGIDADARDGIDENLVRPVAQLEIGGGDVLDHVGDLAVWHRRTQNFAELGALVGATADRHLVVLLAVLLDPEDADVPDVMVTAGIDAAGDVDVQPSEVASQIEILEAARDLLGHRNRARVGQAAVVETGAGYDVGDEIDVGRGDPDFVERAPQRRKIALGNVRKRQILLVADANLSETVALGEIGDGIHLPRGGIARRPSFGLERERHDGIAGELVVGDRIVEPNAETVVRARLRQLRRIILQRLVVGIAESRRNIGDHGGVERERAVLDRLPLLLDLARKFLRAELVDQDLDACLVDVVAPAVLVVGAHDRFDVAEQITLGQEGFDSLAEEGSASEPAAYHHLEAGLAGSVAVHVQADVVNLHRGAIMRRRGKRNLELSRQE